MPKGSSVGKHRKKATPKPKNESIALTVRVSPRVHGRVRWLKYARGISTQEALLEGLNLYFDEHDVPMILKEPTGEPVEQGLDLDNLEEPLDLKAEKARRKAEREAASGSAGRSASQDG